MTQFIVWEVYEETRLCMRRQEIEAASKEEALELAEDCDDSPDRKSDEEYGASGFFCREARETETGDEYTQALDQMDRIIRTPAPSDITIEVEGGCVTDVSGLPDGWTYTIDDKDAQEEEEERDTDAAMNWPSVPATNLLMLFEHGRTDEIRKGAQYEIARRADKVSEMVRSKSV